MDQQLYYERFMNNMDLLDSLEIETGTGDGMTKSSDQPIVDKDGSPPGSILPSASNPTRTGVAPAIAKSSLKEKTKEIYDAEDTSNAYKQEEGNYPTTLDEAYSLVSEWKFDPTWHCGSDTVTQLLSVNSTHSESGITGYMGDRAFGACQPIDWDDVYTPEMKYTDSTDCTDCTDLGSVITQDFSEASRITGESHGNDSFFEKKWQEITSKRETFVDNSRRTTDCNDADSSIGSDLWGSVEVTDEGIIVDTTLEQYPALKESFD